jgi:hypothetical protein
MRTRARAFADRGHWRSGTDRCNDGGMPSGLWRGSSVVSVGGGPRQCHRRGWRAGIRPGSNTAGRSRTWQACGSAFALRSETCHQCSTCPRIRTTTGRICLACWNAPRELRRLSPRARVSVARLHQLQGRASCTVAATPTASLLLRLVRAQVVASPHGGAGAIRNADPAEDVTDVDLDGSFGDAQRPADLLVGQASRHQP